MARTERETYRNLRRKLLAWYSTEKRELPWRRSKDPYRVWVSEIMLQQTRVEAVIPYYERFLRRFPSLQALAQAQEQQVLTAWTGLGYYRRARMLHRAAQEVVAEHAGQFPSDPEEILGLPGIGRYTAGAISSICFDLPEPVLDGNVIRVLTRLFALEGDPTKAPLSNDLWDRARSLAEGKAPGDLNQALMELGATVCLPNTEPRCLFCPLQADCRARAEGKIHRLPELPARRAPKVEHWAVAVATRRGRYLLRQRHGETLLNGLFEFPSAEASKEPSQQKQSLVQMFRDQWKLGCRVGEERFVHRQDISGRRVFLHVLSAEVTGRSQGVRWWFPSQVEQRAVTTATRKILTRLLQESSSTSKQASTAATKSSNRPVKR